MKLGFDIINIEILASMFSILLGLFCLYSSFKIKKEDIEKEEKSDEPKVSGYISLRARKEKTLVTGIIFTFAGAFFLIRSILSN